MTKSFSIQAAQGDFIITKVFGLPDNFIITKVLGLPENIKPVVETNGQYIIAHSETGHHHVVKAADYVELYVDEGNPFIGYLVTEDVVFIEHLRSFDTHETLRVEPGIYRINRQREYIPGGFRRAMD